LDSAPLESPCTECLKWKFAAEQLAELVAASELRSVELEGEVKRLKKNRQRLVFDGESDLFEKQLGDALAALADEKAKSTSARAGRRKAEATAEELRIETDRLRQRVVRLKASNTALLTQVSATELTQVLIKDDPSQFPPSSDIRNRAVKAIAALASRVGLGSSK